MHHCYRNILTISGCINIYTNITSGTFGSVQVWSSILEFQVNFVPSSLGNLRLFSVLGSSNLGRFLFLLLQSGFFFVQLLCIWIKNHIHTQSKFWWIQKAELKMATQSYAVVWNIIILITDHKPNKVCVCWKLWKWEAAVLNPYENRVCVNKQTNNKQTMMKVALFSV